MYLVWQRKIQALTVLGMPTGRHADIEHKFQLERRKLDKERECLMKDKDYKVRQ